MILEKLKRYITKQKKISYLKSLQDGDIVLLWWLTLKKSIKNPPAYFKYKYELDFNNALNKLKRFQLVDRNNNLTELGDKTLKNNRSIIDNHRNPPLFKKMKIADLSDSAFDKLRRFDGLSFIQIKTNLIEHGIDPLGMDKLSDSGFAEYIEMLNSAEKLRKEKEYTKSKLILIGLLYSNCWTPSVINSLRIVYSKMNLKSDLKSMILFTVPILNETPNPGVTKDKLNKIYMEYER